MKSTEIISTIRREKLAVAVKQAMRHELNRTYADIAAFTQVSAKNAWFHVQARKGSNVTPWDERNLQQRIRAQGYAEMLIAAYEQEAEGYVAL